jgi:integrase
MSRGLGTPFFHQGGWYIKRSKKLVRLCDGTVQEKDHYKRHRTGKGLKPRPEVFTALTAIAAVERGLIAPRPSSSGITVAEALDVIFAKEKISTMYRILLTNMRSKLGEKPVCSLTTNDVRQWIVGEKSWTKPSYRKQARKVARYLVRWCRKGGHIDRAAKANEILDELTTTECLAKMKIRHDEKGMCVAIKPHEESLIMEHSSPEFRAFFCACLWMGRRPKEIAGLTRDNFKERDGKLWLEIFGKTGEARGESEKDIPVFDPKAEFLVRKAMLRAGDGLLFPNEHGNAYNDQSWNDPLKTIMSHCPRIRRGMTMYWVRHSFINRLMDAGLPGKFVAQLAGNSERTIREYYRSKDAVEGTLLMRAASEAVA